MLGKMRAEDGTKELLRQNNHLPRRMEWAEEVELFFGVCGRREPQVYGDCLGSF